VPICENWKKNIGKRFALTVAVWTALWIGLPEGFYHAAAEAGITVELEPVAAGLDGQLLFFQIPPDHAAVIVKRYQGFIHQQAAVK